LDELPTLCYQFQCTLILAAIPNASLIKTVPSSAATLMANLTRSAKPGSDWTRYELAAYNITVIHQTKAEFFGVNDLHAPSQPTVVAFMITKYRENAPDEATRKLLHFLDLALSPRAGDEAVVENFVAKLLEKLEYDSVGRIIFFRRSIPLYICGVNFGHTPRYLSSER
jgi:hypothetical protein